MAEFIEKGLEFKRLYEIFYKKFYWVQENPWKEGEAPSEYRKDETVYRAATPR